ncbi:MAG: phosphoribosyltransferase domain-containing protein [Flammeovirgaceae bacterium]
MSNTNQNPILTHRQIIQKIKRIAFEIYERTYERNHQNNSFNKDLVIAGIEGMGYVMASMLQEEIIRISPFNVQLVKIQINKNAPSFNEVVLDCSLSQLQDKSVIVVDDVLNTGRTLAYSMKPFFGTKILCLQVAVLVDRSHRCFPVAADYVGYELSTTVNQHISVVLEKHGECAVYLT